MTASMARREKIASAERESIEFSGGPIDFRNVSDDGSALDLESVVGIPSAVDLYVEDANQQRTCRIDWRTGKCTEVEFTAVDNELRPCQATSARLRASIWIPQRGIRDRSVTLDPPCSRSTR
jgi:hypothetical protein